MLREAFWGVPFTTCFHRCEHFHLRRDIDFFLAFELARGRLVRTVDLSAGADMDTTLSAAQFWDRINAWDDELRGEKPAPERPQVHYGIRRCASFSTRCLLS